MKNIVKLSLAFGFVFGIATVGVAADGAASEKCCEVSQAQCAPETCEREIDLNLYVDIRGKRIHTCCQSCLDKIKANPDKFIKDIEASGVKFDDLENCCYFIEKSPDASHWEFGKLKKIVTPLEFAGTHPTASTPKVVSASMPKVASGSSKKVVVLSSPKVFTPSTPKVSEGAASSPKKPAPGQ